MSPIFSATVVLLSCCGVAPQADLSTERVDLIELNHFFDDQGRHVFDQMIFYDWSAEHNRYQVRAWRLLKSASQQPRHDWERDVYVATWQDGDLMRNVQAQTMRETWTQYDPELAEREYLPKELRRELSQPLVVVRTPVDSGVASQEQTVAGR